MPVTRSTSSNAIPVYLIDASGNTAEISGLYTLQAGGYKRVAGTGSAFAMPAIPPGARRAIIQAEGQALRWRDDGTDPTPGTGMTIPAGGELRYDGADMSALKLIAAASGAVANISYYL